jgi:hypothetical protein
VLAKVIETDHTGVVEGRHRLGLDLKAGEFLIPGRAAGADHLQGNGEIEPEMASAVDEAHTGAVEWGGPTR